MESKQEIGDINHAVLVQQIEELEKKVQEVLTNIQTHKAALCATELTTQTLLQNELAMLQEQQHELEMELDTMQNEFVESGVALDSNEGLVHISADSIVTAEKIVQKNKELIENFEKVAQCTEKLIGVTADEDEKREMHMLNIKNNMHRDASLIGVMISEMLILKAKEQLTSRETTKQELEIKLDLESELPEQMGVLDAQLEENKWKLRMSELGVMREI